MNRFLLGFLSRGSTLSVLSSTGKASSGTTTRLFGFGGSGYLEQWRAEQKRGIMVRVFEGNVDQAIRVLRNKMRDSGMESLVEKKTTFGGWFCNRHIKPSFRRYVRRRDVQYRIRHQRLFRTLRILLDKMKSIQEFIVWRSADLPGLDPVDSFISRYRGH